MKLVASSAAMETTGAFNLQSIDVSMGGVPSSECVVCRRSIFSLATNASAFHRRSLGRASSAGGILTDFFLPSSVLPCSGSGPLMDSTAT